MALRMTVRYLRIFTVLTVHQRITAFATSRSVSTDSGRISNFDGDSPQVVNGDRQTKKDADGRTDGRTGRQHLAAW